MNGLLAFVFIIVVIVGFHESAHFLFMKLWGVKVIRFSIGFGPVLFRKKIGETEYQIAAIPLGGYVLPLSKAVETHEEFKNYLEPDAPEKYFESKPAWQRMVIYLVGPLSNLLFAFILYFVLFAFIGLPNQTTTLAGVAENSPAAHAGMKSGDTIELINGEKVETWEAVGTEIQKSNGKPVKVIVSRESGSAELTVVPKSQDTEAGKRFVIGVMPVLKYVKMDSVSALKEAVQDTAGATMAYAAFFKELFTGKAKKDSFGGPIMIYQMASQSAEQGWIALIGMMIMLNMSLFAFNILPITLLDGGQIYPALFEMLTGIKPGPKFNNAWQMLGVLILGSLFVFTMWNDISRILF